MNDGPEWFLPRRYGIGAGRPIAWQGWVLTILFVASVFVLVLLFHDRPFQMIAVIVPLVVLFTVASAKTTRGGWRWRWGEENSADR